MVKMNYYTRRTIALEELVNHTPASRDLRILLMFCQNPALFISLETIETCGLLLKVAQSSFQRFPRRRFIYVIITIHHELLPQSWY